MNPIYAGFDLELFGRLNVPEPTAEDRESLRRVVETTSSLPSGSRARHLDKALKFLKSNKEERGVLVNILGYLGILNSVHAEGFRLRYIPDMERDEPPAGKIDWQYPVSWWRGGIDDDAVSDWFGDWL